jgi:hypothetical protein
MNNIYIYNIYIYLHNLYHPKIRLVQISFGNDIFLAQPAAKPWKATLDPQIFVKFLAQHRISRSLTTPSLLVWAHGAHGGRDLGRSRFFKGPKKGVGDVR